MALYFSQRHRSDSLSLDSQLLCRSLSLSLQTDRLLVPHLSHDLYALQYKPPGRVPRGRCSLYGREEDPSTHAKLQRPLRTEVDCRHMPERLPRGSRLDGGH